MIFTDFYSCGSTIDRAWITSSRLCSGLSRMTFLQFGWADAMGVVARFSPLNFRVCLVSLTQWWHVWSVKLPYWNMDFFVENDICFSFDSTVIALSLFTQLCCTCLSHYPKTSTAAFTVHHKHWCVGTRIGIRRLDLFYFIIHRFS